MKRLLLIPILFLHFILLGQTISWSDPIDVATPSFGNLHPRIGTSGAGNPVILWGDNNGNVRLSRWNGASFSTPVKVNPPSIMAFAQSWAGPDLACKGDTIYAVLKSSPEDTGHIYIRYSYNGGQSFSGTTKVENIMSSMNKTRFPTIAVDDMGNPIVGFMKFDDMFGNAGWAVSKSSDFGKSFSPEVNAGKYSGGSACDCCPGSVISAGNLTCMLYRDAKNDKRTMWAGASTNNAVSFPSGMSIDNTNWMISACPSSGPDGIIVGDSLYATFMDDGKVYWSKSSISKMSSGFSLPVSDMTGSPAQNYPRMANNGTAVGLIWKQIINGKGEINLLFTKDLRGGFGPTYETVASDNMGMLENTDITLSKTAVHVVWQDGTSGTVKYRKGTYATSAQVNKPLSKSAFQVYPNPTKDKLYIKFGEGYSLPVQLIIRDIAGKILFTKDLINGETVDVEKLENGMYFISLISLQGTGAVKLIINK